MEKWLCWGSIATGGVLFVLFLLHAILRDFPFGRGIGIAVDIVVIVASGVLVYLGWNALRDLR